MTVIVGEEAREDEVMYCCRDAWCPLWKYSQLARAAVIEKFISERRLKKETMRRTYLAKLELFLTKQVIKGTVPHLHDIGTSSSLFSRYEL